MGFHQFELRTSKTDRLATMSREEENADYSSALNGIDGAAGFSSLEAAVGDSGNSTYQIWGTSWRTPLGRGPQEYRQPSSSLETRQLFPNFDPSFNAWRSSSTDEDEINFPPIRNSLYVPTPIGQPSSRTFPFPLASVDIPLDPNPFQGLPERVARKPSEARKSEMVLPASINTEQQSSSSVNNYLSYKL